MVVRVVCPLLGIDMFDGCSLFRYCYEILYSFTYEDIAPAPGFKIPQPPCSNGQPRYYSTYKCIPQRPKALPLKGRPGRPGTRGCGDLTL